MTRYQRVTFRPDGTRRARSVILRDPTVDPWFLRGHEVNREGDDVASGGADERLRIIDRTLVTKVEDLVWDLHYAVLRPAP